jgi:hypothetical protein
VIFRCLPVPEPKSSLFLGGKTSQSGRHQRVRV